VRGLLGQCDQIQDSPQGEGYSPSDLLSTLKEIEEILAQDLLIEFDVVRTTLDDLKVCYSTLNEAYIASEGAWMAVNDFIKSSEQGDSGSYEDLIELIENAMASRFIEKVISASANDLKQRSLANIDICSRIIESSFVNMHTLMKSAEELLSLSKHSCLNNALGKKIKRFYGLCKTVKQCFDVLQVLRSTNQSILEVPVDIISLSENQIIVLRELRNSLERLSIQALDGNESFVLGLVREDFLTYQWRIEALIALRDHASYDEAKLLQESSSKYHISVAGSLENSKLNEAIAQATSYESKGRNVLDRYSAAINEVNTILSTSTQIINEQAEQKWRSLAQQFYDDLVSIRNEHSSLTIHHPTVLTAIKDASMAVEAVYNVMSVMQPIRGILHASMSLDTTHAREKTQVIELFALSNLKTSIALVAERNESFGLAQLLLKETNKYYHDSTAWNDECVSLLPQKSTRLKVSSTIKQRTVEDLEAALMSPISRAVLTPMHDRIYSVLAEVEAARVELLEIIMPSDNQSMDIDDEMSSEVTSSRKKMDYNLSGELTSQLNMLFTLQQKIELIPLDLIELRIARWVYAVYTWMVNAPAPPISTDDDDIHHHTTDNYSISYANAKQKLEEGIPIIAEIPQSLVDALVAIGVINIDENVGEVGFHPSVYQDLKRSGDYFAYFESLVAETDEVHGKIVNALRSKSPKAILQQLSDEASRLVVQIDINMKRDLDRAINSSVVLKPKSVRERMEDVSNEGEVSYWEEPEYVDSISSRKRARDTADSDHRTYSAKVSSMAFKKSKVRFGCLKCNREVRKSQSYCSDNCIAQGMSEYVKALLQYRKLLAVSSQLPARHSNPNVPVKDMEAYLITKSDKSLIENLSKAIQRRGLTSAEISQASGSRNMDPTLATLLSYELVDKPKGWTAQENLKSKHGLNSLINELSVGAQNVLIKTSESSNPSVSSSSSGEPTSPRSQTPNGSSTSFAFPSSSSNGTSNNPPTDAEFRQSVRLGFEEILITCLQKNQVSGAIELGSIFAGEVEEELYQKHSAANPNREWNKKEYKNQMMMIRRNIKQSHNEHLVSLDPYVLGIYLELAVIMQKFTDIMNLRMVHHQL
jgi:hypothetical protein